MDLQTTIFDWFQYREVCDDERFPVYFRRILLRDINAYNELLRVQPGYAHYDWLVNQYNETETTSRTEGTSTQNVAGTNEKTGDVIVKNAGTLEHLGSETTSHEGTDTNTATYDSASTQNGEVTHTADENTDTSGTADTQNIYGKTSTTTPGITETSTTEYQDAADSKDSSINGKKSVNKNAPQSISYSNATAGQIPSLDWGYMTGQEQDETTQTNTYGKHNTSTSTVSRNGNDVIADGGNDSSHSSDSGNTKHTADNKDTYNNLETKHSGTDTSENSYGSSTITSFDGRKDKTDGTNTTTYGTKDASDTTTTSNDRNDTLNRSQSTGRSGNAAAILKEACAYIEGTSAWIWFRARLESCFYSIYDI